MASIIDRARELRETQGLNAVAAARQARAELTSTPTLTPGSNALSNAQANASAQTAHYNNVQTEKANEAGIKEWEQSVADAKAFNAEKSAEGVAGIVNFDKSGTNLTDTYVSTASGENARYGTTSSTPTSSTTNTGAGSTVNGQGNSSTVTGGGYSSPGGTTQKNKETVVAGQTNRIMDDAMSSYDKNNTIDRTQYEQQMLAAEAYSMEIDTNLKAYGAEKQKLADEEDAIQKRKAAEDAQNLAALQAKERELNQAAVEAAQAKSAAAERELAIANDVELQKSNVAFAKLGLNLSTAAATTAQQIYTTGVYNLAKLKSENAFEMADLKVKVAQVEFDHTAKINDIINKSSEKSYSIRKTLNDDLFKIKNSIIDNRLARQEKLDAAVDKYQEAMNKNKDDTLTLMKKSNDTLDGIVKSMYDTLKTKESFHQEKINAVATSGKWFMMTPAQRLDYEKNAGLPKGTVTYQIRGEISKSVVKELDGIPLSAGKLNAVVNEALQLMDSGGMPMAQAIQSALYNSPEYQTQLKMAQAKKNKVGGSGGGTKASGKAGFVDTVKGADGKWYNRYKDPVTGKVTSEISDKQFDEGGKLNTLSTKNNDDGEKPIGE